METYLHRKIRWRKGFGLPASNPVSYTHLDVYKRQAHEKAIEYAANSGAIISFDPNVRLALWDDIDLLRKRINCLLYTSRCV